MALQDIFRLIGQYKQEKRDATNSEEERKLREMALELQRGRLLLDSQQLGQNQQQFNLEQQQQQRLLGIDDAAKSWANRVAFFGNSVQPQPTTPYPIPQGLEAMLPTAQKAMEANLLFGAAPMQQEQELGLLGSKADFFANMSPQQQIGASAAGLYKPTEVATAKQGQADTQAGVYARQAEEQAAKSLLGTTMFSQNNERQVANKQLGDAAHTQKMIAEFAGNLLGQQGNVFTNPRARDGAINMNIEPVPTHESEMMKSLMGTPQTVTLSNGMEIPIDTTARSFRYAPPAPKPNTKVAIDVPTVTESMIAQPTLAEPVANKGYDTLESYATPEELEQIKKLKGSQFISEQLELQFLLKRITDRMKKSTSSPREPAYSAF